MNAWPRVKDDEVWKVGWRTIVRKTFQNPDGKSVQFDVVSAKGSSASLAIALTADNKVIIASQFRPGPERIMSELPGGLCEPGENPLATVKRELLEETGYSSDEVEYIGEVYKDAYSNMVWHYFIARNCVLTADPKTDGDAEHIDVQLITVSELIHNAKSAKMSDCEAVLLAYETLKELERV